LSSPLYEVIPASIRHVKPLAATLRPAACAALAGFGVDARRALHFALRHALYSRTAVIGGEPVAMWGTHGAMMSDQVTIWAAFSQKATKFPLAIVRKARAELAAIANGENRLYASVSEDDERAMVFARAIGFHETDYPTAPAGMVAMIFGGLA
jgi:hypothetical protein